MADSDKNIKRQRAGFMTYIDKLFDGEIKRIMSLEDNSVTETNLDYLKTIIETLSVKLDKVLEIDRILADECEEDADYTKAINSSMDYEVKTKTQLTSINSFIGKHYARLAAPQIQSSPVSQSTPSFSSNSGVKVKLPTLNIKKFSGEPSEYQSFIESFTEAIDKNNSIPLIQKMNYLLGFVTGEAESLLKGLRLSGDNYKKALELLKERFGNSQILKTVHMNRIIELESVCDISEVKELRKLYDSVETEIRNLESLSMKHNEYGPLLVPLLINKVPNELKLILSREKEFDLENILKSFKNELEAREKVSLTVTSKDNEKNSTAASLYAGSASKNTSRNCVFCNRSGHKEQNCSFIKNVNERKRVLQIERRCFVCLKTGHSANNCKSNFKCFSCKGRHHVSICFKQKDKGDRNGRDHRNNKERESGKSEDKGNTKTDLNKGESSNTQKEKEEGENITCLATHSCQVYLQTATSTITSQNASKEMRILFDLGSQLSYISPTAAKQLKLSSNETKNICIKTFGGHVESKTLDVFKVNVQTNEGPEEIKLCCNEICHPIRNDFVYDISSLPEFKNLQIADKGLVCEKSLRVDLLIGADNFWKLVKNKTIRSSKGLVGTETKLGYIFSGPLNADTICSSTQATVTLSAHTLNCQTCDIDSTLRKFWEVEEVGRTENPKEIVLQEFESKIKFEQDRYEVQLPFIEKHEILKDNLYNSTRRMSSLLTKFKTNEQLLHDYDTIIKDQLQQGIIEVAPDTSIEGQTYYMPHRPVLRMDRLTTKIRMVFDASSSVDGPALNDCLHAGPSLTSSLFGTLLRFRAKKIGVIADLEKAFLQIRLNEKDRDYVRFLWIKNINDIDFENFYNNDLVTYRFCRVLFGVTSSPFLLNATLRHHVNKHENEMFRNTVLNSLHVDDLSTSFDSMQEAFDFYKNCKSHFALASLNLRKLQSNCANLEAKIKNCFVGDLETIDQNLTKVLGIPWDKTNDSLVISLSEILRKVNFENPTKRNVIQFASSIFDPLGLINPLVVKFKLLFQKLCTQNLQWDEPIPDDSLKIWKELITDLRESSEIRFNRAYDSNDGNATSHELHGFSDASQDAYGCCVYLKPTVDSGIATPSLVASKSRVAPLKKKTMPQLELLGAQLLSRLLKQVTSELQSKIIIDTCYAWTDSSIVYCWLRNEKLYKQFVQNRVNEIRENDTIKVWKLVDTLNNPSDDNSRGLLFSQLKNNDKWLHGPSFLSGPESSWPDLKPGDKFTEKFTENTVSFYSGSCQFTDLTTDEKITCLTCDESINLIPITKFHVVREYKGDMEREETEGVFSLNTQFDEPALQAIVEYKRFSSLTKLLRVMAMVIGFIRKLRDKVKKKKEERRKETTDTIIETNNNNEIDDMVRAKLVLLRDVQKDFDDKQFDQTKKSLNVFTDSNGILRCHGRIGNAPVPFDTKYPILLPRRHPFTLLVVRDSHVSVGHNKTKETLNHLRQSYWIPKGRSLVRTVINKCQLCKIFEGQKCRYPDAPILPKERLDQNFAFTNIGLDYAGPVHIRNTFGTDESTYKAWIALITCSTTRAVYLDIAQDYSSDALIQMLERFFNRYGASSTIVSDNGSNFTSNASKEFAKSRMIRWSYNIEAAPWQGGMFERMIQSTKRILKKSLRKEILTYNELLTLLKRIENILNNRPLTYVYDSEVGLPPLTPNHLIYGRKIETTNANTDYSDNADILTHDNLKRILAFFWEQWKVEYITSLRERDNVKAKRGIDTTIKVGDVCLIEEPGSSRNNWKMGRVEETIGKDNQIRAAIVKTIKGPLRRPINKLVIIESNKDEQQEIDFQGVKFVQNAKEEIKNFDE